jgi:hypothetical protein
MADIADLKVAISADGSGAIKEIDKVQSSTDKAKKGFDDLGSAGLKLGAVGAAISASIGLCVKSFTSATAEIKNMSNATGISSDALQELKYAAESSGAGLGDVSTAIKTLSRNLVAADEGGKSAQETLTKLGVSSSEIINLKPEEQFKRIAEAINQIPNPAEKSAAAMQIFGKSGSNLLPMISDLDNLTKRANELGIVFDSKLVTSGNNLDNTLGDLSKQFKTIFQLIGASIAPQLENLVNKIIPVVSNIINWIKSNSQLVTTLVAVVGAIGAFLASAGTAMVVISSIVKSLSSFGLAIGALASPLALTVVGIGAIIAIIMNWETVIYALQQAWDFVVKAILVNISTILSAMSSLPIVGKKAKDELSSIASEIKEIDNRIAARKEARVQNKIENITSNQNVMLPSINSSVSSATKPTVPDNTEYFKAIDARIAYEKAQFDSFSVEQKRATLELEKSMIRERLALASVGSQEYYLILQQSYENEKALRELGQYEMVEGMSLAQEELLNHTYNWKEATVGIYRELSSSISTQMQALANGQIKTWQDFGSAVTAVWATLKQSVIKAIADMLAQELASLAISKTIAAAKIMYNAAVGGADAAAKDPNPFTKIATGLIVFAGIAALVGKLAGAYEFGGIIGGTSYTGDKLLAQVNSGEMILNDAQQSQLWALANGAVTPSLSSGTGTVINQTINIESSATNSIEEISEALRNGTQEALTMAGLTYEIGIKQQGYAY